MITILKNLVEKYKFYDKFTFRKNKTEYNLKHFIQNIMLYFPLICDVNRYQLTILNF